VKALVFGEALIDCFPDARVVAGAPLHVAVHLAHLGWESALVSRVGDDADGARILAVLKEHGVSTRLVEVDPERPTGTVAIEFDDEGDHTFEIRRDVAWDFIEGPTETPPCDAFVFGSLAARAGSRAALERLLVGASSASAVFDVNLRPPDVVPDVLAAGVRSAEVVKVNEDEFARVGRLLDLDGEDAWFRFAPSLRWLCVTRGAEGASLRAKGGAWSVSGADVDVVDTVGAGDAFCAGLVDALARDLDAPDALDAARSLAARVLSKRGGLP